MTFTACLPFEQLTLFVRKDGSVDIMVEDAHYNTTIPVIDALVLADAIRRASGHEHVTTELACAACATEPEPEKP